MDVAGDAAGEPAAGLAAGSEDATAAREASVRSASTVVTQPEPPPPVNGVLPAAVPEVAALPPAAAAPTLPMEAREAPKRGTNGRPGG
jgi:hypothetical protein